MGPFSNPPLHGLAYYILRQDGLKRVKLREIWPLNRAELPWAQAWVQPVF